MPPHGPAWIAWLIVSLLSPQALRAETAHLFVLKRGAGGLAIERIPIAAGEVQVIPPSEEIVDLVFPPGVGQSAGLLAPGDGRMFVARRTGDSIRVEVRSSDGSKRELTARAVQDLAAQDIRVCVTGEAGKLRAAFLIVGNRETRRDVGPVANMFAGKLPAAVLEKGYVVQTETYRRIAGPPIAASVGLAMARWPFVRATLPGGATADFVVDLGAGTTVVDRSLLPKHVALEEASMMEYSASGRRVLKYAPGGATGQVQGIVGHATLETLKLGDASVPGVTVDVMERMPDLFGRPVGGILGMDVLRRCDRLALSLGGKAPALRLGAPATSSPGAIELPFAIVATHVLVEASAQGTPVHFILDTGAPTTFLDEAAARACGIVGDAANTRQAHGLDEGGVPMLPGSIGALALGGKVFRDVPCRISALAAFEALRAEDQHAGLLGNDFLARFQRIELDFGRRTVMFLP